MDQKQANFEDFDSVNFHTKTTDTTTFIWYGERYVVNVIRGTIQLVWTIHYHDKRSRVMTFQSATAMGYDITAVARYMCSPFKERLVARSHNNPSLCDLVLVVETDSNYKQHQSYYPCMVNSFVPLSALPQSELMDLPQSLRQSEPFPQSASNPTYLDIILGKPDFFSAMFSAGYWKSVLPLAFKSATAASLENIIFTLNTVPSIAGSVIPMRRIDEPLFLRLRLHTFGFWRPHITAKTATTLHFTEHLDRALTSVNVWKDDAHTPGAFRISYRVQRDTQAISIEAVSQKVGQTFERRHITTELLNEVQTRYSINHLVFMHTICHVINDQIFNKVKAHAAHLPWELVRFFQCFSEGMDLNNMAVGPLFFATNYKALFEMKELYWKYFAVTDEFNVFDAIFANWRLDQWRAEHAEIHEYLGLPTYDFMSKYSDVISKLAHQFANSITPSLRESESVVIGQLCGQLTETIGMPKPRSLSDLLYLYMNNVILHGIIHRMLDQNHADLRNTFPVSTDSAVLAFLTEALLFNRFGEQLASDHELGAMPAVREFATEIQHISDRCDAHPTSISSYLFSPLTLSGSIQQ